MKTAVIGSRSFTDYALLQHTLDTYFITQIISGGAIGADQLAERYAKERNIPTLIFKPYYHKFGKSVPLIRNKQIVDTSELVIAFWDGESRGTAYTIRYAESLGRRVDIIRT